jgi:CBS domain-containing protein
MCKHDRTMKRASRVLAIMTPFPHAVDARESVATAAALMKQHDFRHLPVLEGGRLAGVLSHRDIDLITEVFDRSGERLDVTVWSICSRHPYTVEADEPIERVAEEMANRSVGSVLVTRDGKLAGIVTTTDICRAYAALLREHSVPSGDAEIAT